MIEFKNKKILVLGLKKSGKAAIRLLKTLPVDIYIADEVVEASDDDLFKGTTYIPYDKITSYLPKLDIIIKSPGIPYDIDPLKKARLHKILIISEIELAYQFIDKNKVIVGITGTNGKTTTTALITQILKDSNIECISVGNIGYCLSDAIVDQTPCDVYLVELSSFQLLDIKDFKPHIAILLNISEAHLDYHHTFDHYLNAKMNLFKQMTDDSYLIYNEDEKLIRKKIKRIKCHKYSFSLQDKKADTYIENELIKYCGRTIIKQDDVKLLGKHNLYNVLAAVTTAKVFYIENESIKNTISKFESLPHRIQFVKKINGLSYYNDSKSTNTKSTVCALDAFKEPLILILGGLDRHQDFSEVLHHKNIKAVITYGQIKDRILETASLYKLTCYVCNDLQDAVKLSQKFNKEAETVLFSPASASWDQFINYEDRGNHFIDYVNQIIPTENLNEDA